MKMKGWQDSNFNSEHLHTFHYPPGRILTDSTQFKANQSGEITPLQREAMIGPVIEVALTALLLTVVVLGVSGFLLAEVTTEIHSHSLRATLLLIILACGLLVLTSPLWIKAAQCWLRLYHTWREVSTQQISRAEAHVIWRGHVYKITTHDRTLQSIEAKGLNLLPGNYDCFFLPRSGWVLSVEQKTPTAQGLVELQRLLAQVNYCSVVIPAANRAGRLDHKQIPFLLRAVGFGHTGNLATLILFLLISSCILYEFITYPDWIKFVIGSILIGYQAWRIKKIVADGICGEVSVAEGIGRSHHTHAGRSTNFYYLVDRLRFPVSQKAHNALVTGIPYRLFYTPDSKIIVGIEPLSSNENS